MEQERRRWRPQPSEPATSPALPVRARPSQPLRQASRRQPRTGVASPFQASVGEPMHRLAASVMLANAFALACSPMAGTDDAGSGGGNAGGAAGGSAGAAAGGTAGGT